MRSTTLFSILGCVGSAFAVISSDPVQFTSQSYDYVVVGGGVAGLTVAARQVSDTARLSENPNVMVGVIEAGNYFENDPLVDIPIRARYLQGNATYDWMLSTVPQANLNNRTVSLPRGKALGGSSTISLLLFSRGSKTAYNAWASLGHSKWDWEGLLPYIKAAEHFTAANPLQVYTGANPQNIFPTQGTEGFIAASYNSWYSDAVVPYFKALLNLGVPANSNPDNGNTSGVFNSARSVNSTTGKRSYAANTYYAYNAHRPNFVVLTGARASKIVLENGRKKGNFKATGVTFVHASGTFTVQANKEVILSAGTYKTPQLLELSGVGNSDLLRKYGITPLIDLPGVGENLQDNLLVSTTYELKPGAVDYDILGYNASYAAAAQAQYESTRGGIFTASNSILSFLDLGCFIKSGKIANMTTQLNREIQHSGTTPLQKAQYKIQKNWLRKRVGHLEAILHPGYFAAGTPKANTSYASIVMSVQHPFSRGNVHINSSNPLGSPQIDPKYLSKTIDRDTLVESTKLALKISKTKPLASLIAARHDPAPEVVSDADITAYVKANAKTLHHPVGTAASVPKELGGVVDGNLKVYGTLNLRVVDASVIPIHIGTHLQRTVYGIAEKAAAIISGTH